jgi:hypothetical protein
MAKLSVYGKVLDLADGEYTYNLLEQSTLSPGPTSVVFVNENGKEYVILGEYTEQLVAMYKHNGIVPQGTNITILQNLVNFDVGDILLTAGYITIRVYVLLDISKFELLCITSEMGASRRICKISHSTGKLRDAFYDLQDLYTFMIMTTVLIIVIIALLLCVYSLEWEDE